MSVTFLLLVTLIQFIVQYVLYYPIKSWLYERHSKHPKTLRFLPKELFLINIGCTVVVGFLTGVGLITGITNLFASAILGLTMKIEMDKYKRSLLDGSYYKKLREKREKEKEEQEILERIRANKNKNGWY